MDSKRLFRWACGFAAAVCCSGFAVGCTPEHSFADRHLHPAVFSAAFRGGSALDGQGQKLRFRMEMLGNLKLPSGRVVAIEPFAVQNAPVFTVSVAPGSYPVALAITNSASDPRIAFAEIVFADKPVAYWKMAMPDHFEPRPLKSSSQLVGYPVDGGIGSFMDAVTAADLGAVKQGQGFYGTLDALIAAPPTEPLRALLPAGDSNIAVFASGIGDGYYASYFGFTADGRAVALLTDFGLVPWKP